MKWLCIFLISVPAMVQADAGTQMFNAILSSRRQCSVLTLGPAYSINGNVYAIKMVGTTAYIGGDFTLGSVWPR